MEVGGWVGAATIYWNFIPVVLMLIKHYAKFFGFSSSLLNLRKAGYAEK
jgi:hypothetical protein